MHEADKARYITSGVEEIIPTELQLLMWSAVDEMPGPKDYLQIFRLYEENEMQVIEHTSEEPEYGMKYILTSSDDKIKAKVYVIEDAENITMLLAEEY